MILPGNGPGDGTAFDDVNWLIGIAARLGTINAAAEVCIRRNEPG